jgi:hypothetical protein
MLRMVNSDVTKENEYPYMVSDNPAQFQLGI